MPGEAVAAISSRGRTGAVGRGEILDDEPGDGWLVGEAQFDSFGVGVLGDVRQGLLRDAVERQASLRGDLVLLVGDGQRAGHTLVLFELRSQPGQALGWGSSSSRSIPIARRASSRPVLAKW